MRVGIDVGGTFTDVVALDAATRAIVARIKVPTTHASPSGVAEGIVEGVRRLLASGIDARAIAFIAHSTTQATNALLEGDVARVGIVGLHDRFGWLARAQTALRPLALGARATFAPRIAYARAGDDASIARAIDELERGGIEALVASDAFGVDRPARERRVTSLARERGLLATSGHEVASTYGLAARTRTAALNAAILPRMVRTSEMTAAAVSRAGIDVPLMIMRSDGGVMDVREVARRPILTMLSGPAAGIAGALLHENVTDGIFIEVGGTSADCSVIRRGSPQMRPARIGGFRTMLRTLDVRTLAIAGGSLLRLDPGAGVGAGVAALRDVGPRSAHIAGLKYTCFLDPASFEGARATFVRPERDDPDDYLALELRDGTRAALTPTCAANLLGYVPAEAFARGDARAAERAFDLVGARIGVDARTLARALLDRSALKLRTAIDELIEEYELERTTVELIGGGGGAAALVPFAAERLGFTHRLARDAEVISPVGVALALVRDVVERTIPNATADDVVRVRREAVERVVASGADPALVEVSVELDARRNLVRATASGATAAASGSASAERSEAERLAAIARAARVPVEAIAIVARTASLIVASVGRRVAGAFGSGIGARSDSDVYVVDASATVRLAARRAVVGVTTAAGAAGALESLLERATAFGDVGRALPSLALAYGGRVADLGALAESAHAVALANEELRGLDGEAIVVAIASLRDA